MAEWKQRQQESQAESNSRRKTIRTLEQQIDLLKAQPARMEGASIKYDSRVVFEANLIYR